MPLKPSTKGSRSGSDLPSVVPKLTVEFIKTAGKSIHSTRSKLEEGDKYFAEYLNYPNDSFLKKARQAYFDVEDNGLISNWAQLYAKGMKAIVSAIQQPGNTGSQNEASTVLVNLGRKGYSDLHDPLGFAYIDKMRSDTVSKFPAHAAGSQYGKTISEGSARDGLVFATKTPFIRHTKSHTYIPTYQENTSWEWQEAMNNGGYNIWYKSFYHPPFASSLMNVISDRNVKQASKERFLTNNSECLKSQMIQNFSKSGGYTGLTSIGYNDLKNDIGRRSDPRID